MPLLPYQYPNAKKRGDFFRFRVKSIDEDDDILRTNSGGRKQGSQHPVEIMRAIGGDDDDGDVGHESVRNG